MIASWHDNGCAWSKSTYLMINLTVFLVIYLSSLYYYDTTLYNNQKIKRTDTRKANKQID